MPVQCNNSFLKLHIFIMHFYLALMTIRRKKEQKKKRNAMFNSVIIIIMTIIVVAKRVFLQD